MKKNARIRLTLNRETLRNLSAEEASGAQGASNSICLITDTCYNCPTVSCPTRCGQTYCYGV
jgi:hypothetical protein